MGCSIEDEQPEPGGGGDAPTREEDVHFRICQEMSRARAAAMSPSYQAQNLDRREVIELHEGINSMTILGEVLGRQRPNRLVRVVVANDGSKVCTHQPFPGLDHADMAYIAAKGALDFPPPRICDALVRVYFACVYPYAPILDRVKFMQDYRADRHSSFLLQSILANAVPHAPKELLQEAGYTDRVAAQRSLYSKARLLYDIGCEKSQLHLLQGSVMLSSLSFSYAIDKDYRYWLSNAVRIATQMGLHRNYVSETLGARTKRLFRRIWWVLYNRDTLLTISGVDNLRRFNDRYCDTAPLTESDWEEDTEIPVQFRDILCPIPRLQKLFMVEYSKLSIISGLFIRDFKTPNKIPSAEEIAHVSNEICSWRKQLPPEMQIGTFQEWSSDNIWVLVLFAMGFRLEAVFCRAVKDHYRTQNDPASMQRVAQRQESAMFELSTIIQRASMHEVLHLCPLSFMTCASTILAMRIEIALDPTTSSRKLLATKTQIYAELEYLRESCEYWSRLIWTLRMFEAVVARTGLGLTTASPNEAKDRTEGTPQTNPQDGTPGFQKQAPTGRMDNWEGGSIAASTDADFSMSMADDAFGILPVTDNYNWLQNLLGMEHTSDIMDPLNDFL
ncbi:uncharacterized protein A1O5_01694 [Cladophialophora psammophila CBS 110553]|uniref:Xylanolytic transcriptional activator regulatory domain-containing protein n=1 Tax=Cladophialophora psammophila CBS 110553 TaxID=1182543 RepID=W9X484_9EURO|nr:uncharacterized protein A1O5_01694 [Cladophialophora psammophila CBS 110553]EXJ74998.1 hypothetical protein A1O5_01694 [Cladophialophora psammophila CBS 110553]